MKKTVDMIYRDERNTIDERVDDLIERMTLREKIAQLKSILPGMVIGGDGIDEKKLDRFLSEGLGRIAQFTTASMIDPVDTGRLHNAVQRYLLEKTRLGIPFIAQVECLNGLMAPDATSFPVPLALASTFEPALAREMGEVIGSEMKAIGAVFGLSPVMDLARDGRWGRNYETFGEDKYLASEMGAGVVRGIQGEGVAACAKHFLGYSVSQGGINSSEIHMGDRELYEEYATPFEALINEVNLKGVMCTYSALDGEVVSFSKRILTDLLRDRMGFDGTTVCDGGSVERGVTHQGLYEDFKHAAAAAVKAGLCADAPVAEAFNYLEDAVREDLVSVSDIDRQVRLVLKQKFELGLFDYPYVDTDKIREVFNRPESKAVSRMIAEESIILLKNQDDLLPLKKDIKSLAVIGPHADRLSNQFAGYSYVSAVDMFFFQLKGGTASMAGVSDKRAKGSDNPYSAMFGGGKLPPELSGLLEMAKSGADVLEHVTSSKFKVKTLYESLKDTFDCQVQYEKGSDVQERDEESLQRAVALAGGAEVVVLALGDLCGWTGEATSGEGRDRSSLDLPEAQEELLRAIYDANRNTVLVLFNGRPLSINYAAENVPAILEAWFGGPYGGEAVAKAIGGAINPSGKLPMTIPRSSGQIPIHYNHKCGSSYNRLSSGGLEGMFGGGYTDVPSTPLYAFGHGLSYTNFELSDFKVEKKTLIAGESGEIMVRLKNTGMQPGSETVMLFAKVRRLDVTTNFRQLIGFRKVRLEPGEATVVSFSFDSKILASYGRDMEFSVRPSTCEIEIGTGSESIFFSEKIEITGIMKIDRTNRIYFTQTHVRGADNEGEHFTDMC